MPRISADVMSKYREVPGVLCHYCGSMDTSRTDFTPPLKLLGLVDEPDPRRTRCCQACYGKIYYASRSGNYLTEVQKIAITQGDLKPQMLPQFMFVKHEFLGSWVMIPRSMMLSSYGWIHPKLSGEIFDFEELNRLQPYLAMKTINAPPKICDETLELIVGAWSLPKPAHVYAALAEVAL